MTLAPRPEDITRNADATQAWLDTVEVVTDLTDLTEGEITAARSLLGHPGMKVLLGLMIGARQGFYVQLGNMGLGDEAAACRASVIQGMVKGIDLLPSTLLELVAPAAHVEPSQETPP